MISSNKLKSSKNSNRDEAETEGANSDESFDPDKNEKHGSGFLKTIEIPVVLNCVKIAGPSRNKAKFSQRLPMPGRGGFRGRKAEQNLRSRKFEGSRSDGLGGKSCKAQLKFKNLC